jgi:hypothetical protein
MLDLEFVKLMTISVHKGGFRGLTAKPVQLSQRKRSRALRLLQKDKLVVTLWALNETNKEQVIRMLCFPVRKDSHVHEGLCGTVRRYARSWFADGPLSSYSNLLPNYESISHSRSRIVVHELLPRTVLHT